MDTATLEQKLDGLGGEIQNFLTNQTANKEALNALKAKQDEISIAMGELKTAHKETEDWVREVEGKASRRAETGYDGRNALREAIPERDRRFLYQAQAHGIPDVVPFVARALWLQKTLMRQGAMEKPAFHNQLCLEIEKLEKGFGDELVSHAAQGETTTGTGPELILTPVEAEILRLVKDNSYIRQVARVMPMVSKTHQIPSLDTDVIAYFTAEAATITDSMSATNWSQKALTAKKLAGLATVSAELLQDNIVGLADFLFGAIAEQIGRLEDTEAIEGAGTNWTGVNAASGVNTVAAGTDGDAVTYAKIVTAIFKASDVDSRQNFAWFMSPLEAIKVFGLTDTNGAPIFQLPNAMAATALPQGARGTLMSYPCFVHSGILTNRTKGSGTSLTNIYAGNWKKLIIGDLLGLTFATDPYSLFSSDSVKVRVTKRTGCVVGVPKAFTVVKDLTT